jgi:NAD(P)H-dependent flavin oxidoreductase YrpB (nitropropane dioxygenase family)
MGADLAYIGSAFVATREANATQANKEMIVESRASDIVYSNLFTGITAIICASRSKPPAWTRTNCPKAT